MKNYYLLIPSDLKEAVQNSRSFLSEDRPEHKRVIEIFDRSLEYDEKTLKENEKDVTVGDIFKYFKSFSEFEKKLNEVKITINAFWGSGHRLHVDLDGKRIFMRGNMDSDAQAWEHGYCFALKYMIDKGIVKI